MMRGLRVLERKFWRDLGLRGEVFSEIASVRREVLELRRDLNARFYWLMRVQISMWVTIILSILFRVH